MTATLDIRRWAAASLAAALIGPAFAAPGAHGPDGEHLEEGATTVKPSGLARLPDGSVNVPKLAQRRIGVRTVLAPESEAAVTVQLPGRVIVDPNASGRVQAVHGGRIEPTTAGLPVAGQRVRKGQVLAYVRHHAEPYAQAGQESLRAELQAALTQAEQRVARLEGLVGSVPQKEIDAARVERDSLRARSRSVRASLGAREALVAPVDGVVARADATIGQVVEVREILFEVVDPARALIEATTIDARLADRIASAAVAEFPGVGLALIGAARSLREGSLPLTFRIERGGEQGALPFAIGQPVTVVAALTERTKGIVLPARAVVRGASNLSVVWIKAGAERFLPQPVEVRALDAETVLVTAGLGADNRVVVEGAALIAQIR